MFSELLWRMRVANLNWNFTDLLLYTFKISGSKETEMVDEMTELY